MHSYRVSTSDHFKEVIGRAVFRVQKNTNKFNTDVLDNCGYGLDRLTLCQKLCNLYPNDNYFKKLYYISAFILDMVFWWHKNSDAADLSMGPNLWITIFRSNFEGEFEIRGGWQGLAEAGSECCELLPNEILPGEALLPAYLKAVIAAIRELNPIPEEVDPDEAILESLDFERMQIDDASVAEVPQVEKSKEETKEKQPEEVVDRPSLHSPALGGNVVQTEDPCEGTSEKSGEGALRRLGSRSQRKRRRDTPPKSDSDSEQGSLSPSKPKLDRR
ncbi:hypothetical protein AVEN_57812-1 [Araneus ventricosus]|uniref:Uncharacterized protein n=1 Tax=Araneus ventricosus TaxID=182803 RepID=A0A4Y2I9B4_ARAVE|nr:hypothetical protein AVEN_57812-1 [Araneus ventricosus]